MNELLALLTEATAVFAVALLAARLASKARASVRHQILASAFGVVLVLPLATLMSPAVTVEIAALPEREIKPLVTNTTSAVPIAMPNEVEPLRIETSPVVATRLPIATPRFIPVGTWLLLAWAVVALGTLVPVGVGLWRLRSIRRRSHPWPEGDARVHALAHTSVMQQPAVLLHDGIVGPLTDGLFRPVIILPSEVVTWTEPHIANAIVHELEHVRRHDWAVQLASRVVCAAYWFHPLAWIAWRALRLEAERACDDAVLEREDAAAYADQLLELARRLVDKPRLPGMQMASGGNLASRIRALLDNTQPRGRAGRITTACVAILALLALAALAPLRASGPLNRSVEGAASQLTSASPAVATESQRISGLPSVQPFVNEKRMRVETGGAKGAIVSSPPTSPTTPARNPDRTRPPIVDTSTGGFTIRRLAAPTNIDGKLWIAPNPIRGGKTFTAPGGQFTLSLTNPDDEGDIERYRVMFTRSGGQPVNLIPEVTAYAFVTGDSHWIFLEPLDVVDVRTWRRYRLSERFAIAPYVSLVAVSADGQHLIIKRQECAFGCRNIPDEYYEIGFPGSLANTPRKDERPVVVIAARILDLVQSTIADDSSISLDELTRPITGLEHMQRFARAVVNDDGRNPADLAANCIELINALGHTADLAAGVALRRPAPRLSPPKFAQLAAALRMQAAELAAALMPAPAVTSIVVSTPEHRAAISALDLAQTTLGDTSFARHPWHSWLVTELNTLEQAAQSVLNDNGESQSAPTSKLYALMSSIRSTSRQADEISRRTDETPEARSKAAGLAYSLQNIVPRLEAATRPVAQSIDAVESTPGHGG